MVGYFVCLFSTALPTCQSGYTKNCAELRVYPEPFLYSLARRVFFG